MINGKTSVVDNEKKQVHLTQVEEDELTWTEELLIHFKPTVVID